MTDFSRVKLGRKAIKTDSRTLQLAHYLTAALPAPPVAEDWTKGITSWGMMHNDTLGDCTIAAVGHAIQVWTANIGKEVTVSDQEVLHYYEVWDGYKPGDPSTDQGGIELDVLNDWKKSSFDKHKLLAFADPAVANLEQIRQAITLFGGVYIGLQLPLSAQAQVQDGKPWDVVKPASAKTKPGSWGGHAVFVPKFDADTFTCITWGQLQPMTVAFWHEYVDEAHALLSHDWLDSKRSPAGFNLAQLEADLAQIH